MQKTEFLTGWRFAREGQPLRPVSIPHDAMLLEPRAPKNPSGAGGAFFAGGCYTYENTFLLPPCGSAALLFEGIYPTAEFTLDGRPAAAAAYGYGDCYVDCSALTDGRPHTVRVYVDHTRLPDSRWYSGAGIYRPVWLFTGPEAHIRPEGIRVTTLSVDPAVIRVETDHTGGEVSVEILDGETVVAAGTGGNLTLSIPNAKLWDAEHPNLYTCRAVLTGGDQETCRFGIRTIAWSHDGLRINGQTVKLRGGCIHHDNGVIGARSFAYTEYRRMKKLKDCGFNAVRSAHNPMCRSLLEACDRLGLYVMDETWDMWYSHKNAYDYADRFPEHWEQDVEAMVAKDYSHPSVIFYSIGNEVTEPFDGAGVEMTCRIRDKFHQLDATRPVTAGINPTLLLMRAKGMDIFGGGQGEQQSVSSEDFNRQIIEAGERLLSAPATEAVDRISSPCLDCLDVAGYNYATSRYERDAVEHPARILVGSETFPQSLPENWALVERLPYLIGDFLWTAWDYLGETGIGAWTYDPAGKGFDKEYPWLLADVGVLDILGDDGAEAGMAGVVWRSRTAPYIAVQPVNRNPADLYRAMWRGSNGRPSWSWRGCDGRTALVEVYSRAAAVELMCNGVSLGRKPVGPEYKAEFAVPYTPGTLTAVGYDAAGNPIGETSLTSATGPLRLALRQENPARPGQPVYVNVDIVGENGVLECACDKTLTIRVEGAELLGFGSANPKTEERFETGVYTTYYGRSQAVLLPERQEIRLTATAVDLPAASLTIPVADCP